jgi:hypothetical protein
MSKRKGITDIRSYARQHTETAIKTLVSIATCKKSTDSARVAASTALLDRGWGKAAQYVEMGGDVKLERIERIVIDAVPAQDTPIVDTDAKRVTH